MGEQPTWKLTFSPLLLLVVGSLVLNNCGAPQTYDPQGSNTCSLKVRAPIIFCHLILKAAGVKLALKNMCEFEASGQGSQLSAM